MLSAQTDDPDEKAKRLLVADKEADAKVNESKAKIVEAKARNDEAKADRAQSRRGKVKATFLLSITFLPTGSHSRSLAIESVSHQSGRNSP